MEYVNLGSTGLRVSRVCLGMMSFGNDSERAWVLDEDAAEPIVRAAVDGGITFFDTADTYSAGASEIATGRLLGLPAGDEVSDRLLELLQPPLQRLHSGLQEVGPALGIIEIFLVPIGPMQGGNGYQAVFA